MVDFAVKPPPPTVNKMNLLILSIATILTSNYAYGEPVESNCESPQTQSDALRIDVQFQLDNIVPDIIPTSPGSILGVTWGNAEADLGNCINRVETLSHPYFSYDGADSDANYTLIVLGIDPQSRSAMSRPYLRNLCVNISGRRFMTQTSGFSVASYLSPNPGPCVGTQRILVLLYQQAATIDVNNYDLLILSVNRVEFDLEAFIDNYSLGELVSGNYWLTSTNCCNTDVESCCN